MPEAFAVLVVFVVAVASYAGARMHAADPANHRPEVEAARLKQHHAWLKSRLQQARRENWDQDMVTRLADELEETEAELARINPPQRDAA